MKHLSDAELAAATKAGAWISADDRANVEAERQSRDAVRSNAAMDMLAGAVGDVRVKVDAHTALKLFKDIQP
jgi:hypothetical protein